MTQARSPLEQLLHALNQPLTGLQCSMEVALASPRTPEQYVQGLREGLGLTERMRALVGAIREVVDGKEDKKKEDKRDDKKEEQETIEWKTFLQEILDELAPVAEVKSVRVTLDCSAVSSLAVSACRRRLVSAVFRLLESALSLAARGSALRIETGVGTDEVWIRIGWHAASPPIACSRPELGLLVAQAGFERGGAEWTRERAENRETVTVRLPGVAADARNS
jgi:signal transduction histidine kinase